MHTQAGMKVLGSPSCLLQWGPHARGPARLAVSRALRGTELFLTCRHTHLQPAPLPAAPLLRESFQGPTAATGRAVEGSFVCGVLPVCPSGRPPAKGSRPPHTSLPTAGCHASFLDFLGIDLVWADPVLL